MITRAPPGPCKFCMRASLYIQHSGAVHVYLLGNYYDFIIIIIINFTIMNFTIILYYDYIDLIVIITMIIIMIRFRYDYIEYDVIR